MQFPQENFVKFVKNFSDYIKMPVVESDDICQKEFSILGGGDINFPVGKLNDLTIYF